MPFAAAGGALLTGAATAAGGALVGSLLGGGGGDGGAAAAADPFASQRPQYQSMLQSLMTNGFSSSDPSYQWRMQQGQQATERSLGASGMLNSGNRLAALTEYGQGMASTEFANQFSRLSQLAGGNVGSPAAAGQILQGTNLANQQAAGAVGNAVGKWVSGWGNNAPNYTGGSGFSDAPIGFGQSLSLGSDSYSGDAGFGAGMDFSF